MHSQLTYRLVILGLLGLLIALPWWLHVNTAVLGLFWAIVTGITVPGALLFAVLTRSRNWSGITALCMIPFASIGIMEIVANLRELDSGMLIAILSIVTFFAALDAGRRSPPN